MMSTIDVVNYTIGHGTATIPRLRRLAAARAVLFQPAGEPAADGRRTGTLTGAVPRAAPDRAGPSDPDGVARRNAGMRRVECDGARRSAGVARPGAPSSFRRRSTGQGAGSHAERLPAARAPGRADDGAAREPAEVVGPGSTGARPHPRPSAGLISVHACVRAGSGRAHLAARGYRVVPENVFAAHSRRRVSTADRWSSARRDSPA